MNITDNNLVKLLNDSLNGYNYDIAKIVYYLYKDDYVCAKLKSKLWYKFINHKWKQTELGPYSELSTNIVNIYEDYKKDLLTLLENPENNINSENILKIETIIIKLKNVTYKENICRECLYLFYDSEFILKLDRNIHLIAFTNGILDLSNKKLRNGEKKDFVSLSIDIEYNQQNLDKIDQIINQFIHFRKKVLEKRLPNHIFKIQGN
jgi:phage/plasmid-associated DNA primase